MFLAAVARNGRRLNENIKIDLSLVYAGEEKFQTFEIVKILLIAVVILYFPGHVENFCFAHSYNFLFLCQFSTFSPLDFWSRLY